MRAPGLAGATLTIGWFREGELAVRQSLRLSHDGIAEANHRFGRDRYPAGGAMWHAAILDGDQELATATFMVIGPCSRTHDCEIDDRR